MNVLDFINNCKRKKMWAAAKSVTGLVLAIALLAGSFSGAVNGVAEAAGAEVLKESSETNAKVSKEEAAKIAISLFPELEEAEMASVEYGNRSEMLSETADSMWTITWMMVHEQRELPVVTQVDALNGDLIGYYSEGNGITAASIPPKVTLDEAILLAKKFILEAAPSLNEKRLLLSSEEMNHDGPSTLFHPIMYSFEFNVSVNGYKTDSEYINLSMSSNGKIISYEAFRAQTAFPSPDKAMSKERALGKLKELMKLELMYLPSGGYSPSSSLEEMLPYRLGYVNVNDAAAYIDAFTGEAVFDEAENAWNFSAFDSTAEPFAIAASKDLTKQEAIAAANRLLPLPHDAEYSSSGLQTDWRGTGSGVWELEWRQKQKQPFSDTSYSAAIDVRTGQLLDYRKVTYEDSGNKEGAEAPPAVTEQAARRKAIDLVTALYPDASKKLRIHDLSSVYTDNGETYYQFYFLRYYNDIPVAYDYVNVTIDGKGELANYAAPSFSEQEAVVKIVDLRAAVAAEKALSLYKESLSTELNYITIIHDSEEGLGDLKRKETRLVYSPLFNGKEEPYFVDAITGELEPMYAEARPEAGSPDSKPVDIANHWAGKELALLNEYGIFKADEEGLLHPESPLTKGDWMNAVLHVFYSSYEYDDTGDGDAVDGDSEQHVSYESAVQFFAERGWLEDGTDSDEGLDQTLTRDQLTPMLAEMLNYVKLSKRMANATELAALKDISRIKNKGAAAIVLKLGLMTSANGKFNPDAPVTKAQASIILIRLVNLQEELDTPFV